jgi:hypothetical protein
MAAAQLGWLCAIGNLEAAPPQNGEVQAKTAFLVYRSHLETDHQLLSSCCGDLLRKVNGAWKWSGARLRSTPTFCSTRTSASSSRGVLLRGNPAATRRLITNYRLPPFSLSWTERWALTSLNAPLLASISHVLSQTSSMARHAILSVNPISSGSPA